MTTSQNLRCPASRRQDGAHRTDTSNVVSQYDTAANTWKKVPDLPFVHGSNGACTVTDDGWLYAANGIDKMAHLKLL